jgi:hypothetical protein
MATRSKFKPGQFVSVSSRSKLGFSPKGTYRIVRARSERRRPRPVSGQERHRTIRTHRR